MAKKTGKVIGVWVDKATEKWIIKEAEKRKWTKSFFAAETLREKMREAANASE